MSGAPSRLLDGLRLAVLALVVVCTLGPRSFVRRGPGASGPEDIVLDAPRAAGDGSEVVARAAPDGRVVARMQLSGCNDAPERRVDTRLGWARVETFEKAPRAVERLIRAANDLGPPEGAPPRCDARNEWPIDIARAAALAAACALVLGLARRARTTLEIRVPHAVPIAIQLLLYAYWSLYWEGVAGHARSILLQVALAYALEAALAFAVFRSWTVGLGPLPVVLSANLFAWFDPVGSIVVVSAAIGSKTLLRRNGRHLLNPSAAGLSAGGLYLLLWPGATWDGLFHLQNLAPNLVELVLVLSLLPLLRFRLGLVPLGALIAFRTLPGPKPGLTTPGTIIAFALFASDPATTPKTPAGRLLYGLFVGAVIVALSSAFVALGRPDDFSKVLAVPIANLLAPSFDRVASRAARAMGDVGARVLDARMNAAHVALWCATVLGQVAAGKGDNFEAALHWTYGTPLVGRDADDVPRCALSPAFCRPFAVISEVRGWVDRRRGAAGPAR